MSCIYIYINRYFFLRYRKWNLFHIRNTKKKQNKNNNNQEDKFEVRPNSNAQKTIKVFIIYSKNANNTKKNK